MVGQIVRFVSSSSAMLPNLLIIGLRLFHDEYQTVIFMVLLLLDTHNIMHSNKDYIKSNKYMTFIIIFFALISETNVN